MNFIHNSRSHPELSQDDKPSFDSQDEDDMSFGRSILLFIWETVKVVIISLLIIIPVRYFLVQPFFVNGASMEPNFFDHEYLIVDEISYRFRQIERGDIVVFRYPRDPGQFFIKRVIGLPGETVTIKQGRVTIKSEAYPDGVVLDESSYLSDSVETRGDVTVRLGGNEYYVMGDNRQASLDSRSFGPITVDLIVGRAWLRGWPIDRVSVFRSPQYNF